MRRLLVALVTLGLAGLPSVANAATCPSGATGTNPAPADISTLLTSAAANGTPQIPVGVLKAIAYQESEWRLYDAQGHVVISSDSACGVGIMQVTAADDPDPDRLATDIAYNIAQGAAILRAKWAVSQQSNEPNDTNLDDDPAITENWYYAVCLYNGCGSDPAYPSRVSQISADPFRRVPDALKPYLPIQGFTSPQEADETYVFPNAFQARPGQFVFYDEPTGNVTKTVSAPTHAYNGAPPTVSYGTATYGPDGPYVSCVVCGGWRLAETRGVAGRAHWTRTQATEGTRVTWAPPLPRTGLYRVQANVPDVSGLEPMGTATYHLAGVDVPVDQAANAGHWVGLGDRTLSPGGTVYLTDVATTANKRVVADALRISVVTKLELTASTSALTYGQTATLTARLSHLGTPTGLSGKPIALYRRRAGTSAWSYGGTFTTGTDGRVAMTTKPTTNTEYQVRVAVPGYTAASSAIRRIDVRPVVKGAQSRTTAPRNAPVTFSVSVGPSHAGQTVVLQRYSGGAWRAFRTLTLNRYSAASITFGTSTAGLYQYRFAKPADADHAAAFSATMTLRVT